MRKLRLLMIASLLGTLAPAIGAVDPLDTKLLTQPAIGATHVATQKQSGELN